MSDLLQIALVAEGPTDKVVIESALQSLLADREYVLIQLQPERAAFGKLGAGWSGVYQWCRQAVRRSKSLRQDIVLTSFDVLIVQLDADVAEKRYQDAGIDDSDDDLPCVRPCPPPSATTDELRQILLRWMGEKAIPSRVVICTPSKSLESWVIAALHPEDKIVKAGELECRPEPEALLVSKPSSERLVRRKGTGYHKQLDRYENRATDFQKAWPSVRKTCTEADRFSIDFLNAISSAEK